MGVCQGTRNSKDVRVIGSAPGTEPSYVRGSSLLDQYTTGRIGNGIEISSPVRAKAPGRHSSEGARHEMARNDAAIHRTSGGIFSRYGTFYLSVR